MAWLAALWLGRGAALPAAWLAAGSPYLVWYSQEARCYSLLMLCVVLSCVALLSLARRPGARAALVYGAAAAAGLLSSFSFVMIAPLHLRWWLGDREERGRRIRLLALTAAGLALVALPWAPRLLRVWDWHRLGPGSTFAEAAPLRGNTTFHAGAIPFALHAFAVGYTLGPSLRELRAAASPRTLAHHAPGIAAARVAAGAAVGVIWAVSLHHAYFDSRYAKEDYRSAAALIRERGAQGEVLLSVNSDEPMVYYYRGPLPQTRLWLGFAGHPDLDRRLTEALGNVPGVWVVLSRPEDLDPGDRFARALDARYSGAQRWSFAGVRVWHIRRS